METCLCKVFNESGILFSGPCVVIGHYVGNMDGVNDPEYTFYNGLDNSGDEYIPTNPIDASAKGLNGAMQGVKVRYPDGCYVEMSAQTDISIAVLWKPVS